MIKRTLYFGKPAYLSLRNQQMEVRSILKDGEKHLERTIPIEDIGIVLLDHQQLTMTHGLMNALLEANAAVITCSPTHMPSGLLLPLDGHTLQSERFRLQILASLPLKKQLWQQTIKAKILNQAKLLSLVTESPVHNMLAWVKQVRSGDSDNLEARAAVYYWANLFRSCPDFVRGREESMPNALLNYGYAILRGIVGRALVASGLLPTLGIHHHNRYNAYCLADDIMEPYRPYVDQLVVQLFEQNQPECLTSDHKRVLLSIPEVDVSLGGQMHPLMVAVSLTTGSLFRCFEGTAKTILYPQL